MLGQIIPIIERHKANRSLREKNSDVSQIKIPQNIDQIDIKYIEEDYKATIEAKNRFEDKAKTIIAALTIAITLILNLSKIIDTIIVKIPLPYFNYVVFGLAILAIVYMLMAGIMSIQVLIKENLLYSVSLEDRTSGNKKSIYQVTRQNINQNLIRNNIIYAAYVSIRNSVICLLIIFGLAIYPYQTSMESCNNATLSDSEKEIMYSGEAVDWLVNNTQKEIDFDKIIEFYQKNCNDGMQKNMYDEEQKVIITIEFQNDKYFVSDIKSNIVEIN